MVSTRMGAQVPAGGLTQHRGAAPLPGHSLSLTVPRNGAYDDFSRLLGQAPTVETALAPRPLGRFARSREKAPAKGRPDTIGRIPATSGAVSDTPCRPAQPDPQHADERSF